MKSIFKDIIIALRGTEKDFTSGSINRAILLLSVPMILEMVMESLFAVVDIFFVAQIGKEAVNAVGLTEVVLTVIYAIAIGISMAATAMVARRIGEDKPEAASHAAAQVILVGFLVSVFLGIFGFIFSENILQLMGADEAVIRDGIGYTRIMFGGNIVIFMLFLLNAIFRGAGDAAIAMRSLWLANIINMVLDPLFIFGIGPFPELGVQGAAVASTIGRGSGVLFQLWILFNGKSIIRILRRHIKPDGVLIRRILDVSVGGAGQFLIGSASWIFLMRVISEFGTSVVAGYTIAIRVIIFTILPSWGMSNAAATLVGQNLGAGKPERAEASVWKAAWFNMLFLLGVSVVFFISAPYIIGIFDKDPDVIAAGTLALQVLCITYVFFAYGMVLSQSFNGAGDTRTPTVVNFLCLWIIQIPMAYWMALYIPLGPIGVYIAVGISEAFLAAIFIYWFRKGKWKEVVV